MQPFEYTMGKEVDLVAEQERTLQTQRLRSNMFLKTLYLTFDLIYGKARTLPKIVVLEILARYPYWAWENGSYQTLSRLLAQTHPPDPHTVEDMLYVIQLGRESQDNEQWHMLLLADIINQKGYNLGWFKHFLVPRILAWTYYYLTRIIYFLNPRVSFAMNAAFESHAEREYMLTAKEHPEWESEEINSIYFKYYPQQKSLCDLLRRIALDERDHMNHSLEAMERFNKCSDAV